MTILALLGGLIVNHFVPAVNRLRHYGWLLEAIALVRFSGQPAWVQPLATLLVPVVIGILATLLVGWLSGAAGLLVLGVLTIAYTLGPRDLDQDIRHAHPDNEPARRQLALEHLQLEPHAEGPHAAAAALHAGLARWFGVVFWFAVLGVPGALLYRTARIQARHGGGEGDEQRWLAKIVYVLNWPVIGLMLAASALMTDFDRVYRLWRDRPEPWQFDAGLLDTLARELCAPGADLTEGLNDGRRLLWRMLGLWLAVLSLLLLAGLLS